MLASQPYHTTHTALTSEETRDCGLFAFVKRLLHPDAGNFALKEGRVTGICSAAQLQAVTYTWALRYFS